jgi:hypothetical protein
MRTNDLTAARHHGLMAALTGANVMTFANKVDDLFWCRYLKCQWRVWRLPAAVPAVGFHPGRFADFDIALPLQGDVSTLR